MADRHLMALTANHALVAKLDADSTLIDRVFDGIKAIVREHPHVIGAWARFELARQDRSKRFRPHLHGVLIVRRPIRVAEIAEIWREVVPVDEGARSVDLKPIDQWEGGLYGWMKYSLKPLSSDRSSNFAYATPDETRQVNELLAHRQKVRFYPHTWQAMEQALGEHGVSRAGSAYDRSLLSDDEWASVRPHIPRPATGRPPRDHRLTLEAILWVERGGGKWEDMPAKYGTKGTVSSRYSRWKRDGVWAAIAEHLRLSEADQ